MKHFSLVLFCLALTAGAIGTARAQDAGGAQRCGGLLCDMGMFGGAGSASKALPCNDFVCRAFGGHEAEAAPPPPAPLPAADVAPPMKHKAKKKKLAKADTMPVTAPK